MSSKSKHNPNGAVLYEGPSRIDGKPIVVLLTGIANATSNPKTGDMLQTWILRSDVNPTEALKTGDDSSICGGCPHRPQLQADGTRGKRTCYVNPMGPNAVWKAYKAGKYIPFSALSADLQTDYPTHVARLVNGRHVRLGAYGDPAAAPIDVWHAVVANAAGWTGYTHQWKSPKLRDVLQYCQLSADSCDDAEAARNAGIGYFRVKAPSDPVLPGEMVCPASEEAGKVKTCAECRACSGFEGARVVIDVHGTLKGNYGGHKRRAVTLPVLNPARVPQAA